MNIFPLRTLYLLSPEGSSALKAGFSVSSRNFKKATDRNRIKRLMRESYRTQKEPLLTLTGEKKIWLSVFFIYTGKGIPEHILIKEKMRTAIKSLAETLNNRNT